jgi:hypothetical protein
MAPYQDRAPEEIDQIIVGPASTVPGVDAAEARTRAAMTLSLLSEGATPCDAPPDFNTAPASSKAARPPRRLERVNRLIDAALSSCTAAAATRLSRRQPGGRRPAPGSSSTRSATRPRSRRRRLRRQGAAHLRCGTQFEALRALAASRGLARSAQSAAMAASSALPRPTDGCAAYRRVIGRRAPMSASPGRRLEHKAQKPVLGASGRDGLRAQARLLRPGPHNKAYLELRQTLFTRSTRTTRRSITSRALDVAIARPCPTRPSTPHPCAEAASCHRFDRRSRAFPLPLCAYARRAGTVR